MSEVEVQENLKQETTATTNFSFDKAIIESFVIGNADLRSSLRKLNKFILVFVVTTSIFIGGFGIWFYQKALGSHVRFVTEAETKTLIGVRNHGRIQVNIDDRTGESIIEVYHAKK